MNRPAVNSMDKKFLVVDRNEETRHQVEQYLKIDGAIMAQTVDTFESALRIIRTYSTPVDCIVSAANLSPHSGVELLKGLRGGLCGKRELLRGLKFVMMSKHREMELIAAVKALDIDGFVLKPFDFKTFSHSIHTALSRTFELKPAEHYLKVDIKKAAAVRVGVKS